MATRHSGHRALGLVVVLVAASGTAAIGQELSVQARRQLRALYVDKAAWTAAERKLDTSLLYASRDVQGLPMVQGLTTDRDFALLRRVTSRAGVDADGLVVVDMRAEVTDGLLMAISAVGGKVQSVFPAFGAVRARIPARRVVDLAARDEVRHIDPQQQFLVNTGLQTSQGDAAHRAAAARTTYGVDGTGIKVGVLSDGVDTLLARQTSGDLPPTCASPPVAGACVMVVPGQQGSGDEGTAMMEIVHDLAPGAQLYFATAVGGDAAFASNILALKNTYGCDIIVDDFTYLNEGAFQDGIIAQAVTTVKNAGALYFSSAGNSGRKDAGTSGTWEKDWVYSGCVITITGLGFPYDSVPLHSFTGGSTGCADALAEYLTAAYSSGHLVTLKWSDPLAGSANDYDLFAFDGSSITDASVGAQTGTQDPIEGVFAYLGDYLLVTQYSGDARALRIDTNRARLAVSTAGAVVGHNGGQSTITVAATDGRIPGAGNPFVGGSTNPVETYSSDGNRRMFYNANGTAITPGNVLFGTNGGRTLPKPDITAADCVTTTTPDFIPFCGTSAAAPHAAAIAALLKSAPESPDAAHVFSVMVGTALDVTPGAGRDRNSGVGIVMADVALAALPPLDFYSLSPCRVADSRATGGALTCGTERAVMMTGGTCGVPTDAKAVSINVTATAPTANGNLRVYAAGSPAPSASTLNYTAWLTRANNAVAPVNASGQMAILCSPARTTHIIVDVNGYFK
jgi:hypothetical protein